MAAAKNRQPDRTPYGIGRLVGITYRKVQLESLRALKLSALRLRLTDAQVEDIFYHNARKMLEMDT